MSSTGANRETEGGTLKNVIDNPETKPQSHEYAEDQSHGHAGDHSHSNTHHGNNKHLTSANQESEGGTMKNVIDNPETKPPSHKQVGDQSHSNTQQGNNKCSSGGSDHKPGESSCDNCHKK